MAGGQKEAKRLMRSVVEVRRAATARKATSRSSPKGKSLEKRRRKAEQQQYRDNRSAVKTRAAYERDYKNMDCSTNRFPSDVSIGLLPR